MRIHSELRELLSQLLFVDGSLYTYDVVLLLYHVLRECPSECSGCPTNNCLVLHVQSTQCPRKLLKECRMVGRVCVLEEDPIAQCSNFKSPEQKDPRRFAQFDIEHSLPVEAPGVFT